MPAQPCWRLGSTFAGALSGALVLDEPNTHLDLPSLHALELMLGQFRGAMRVVAHDLAITERLQPTGYLRL